MNLACFEVAGQIYAIEVGCVREVVRLMEITPLPNAPRLIEGVIDLRGVIVPVLDLARVLNRGTARREMQARIVVIECDGLVFGLWVDAATEVITPEAATLEDVPSLATQAGYDAVRHVVRQPKGRPALVLAVEMLIERVYRSELPAAGAEGDDR